MSLDVSGFEQSDQPVAVDELLNESTATVQAIPAIDAVVTSSGHEWAALGDEIIAERYPALPPHSLEYLRSRCDEAQLPFALEEASAIDPAELSDPDLASFLLDDCISSAEIAALDQQEQQLDRENAALSTEEQQINADNAATQTRIDQGNTTNEELINQADIKEQERDEKQALVDLIQTSASLRNLRGSDLLNELAQRREVTQSPELSQYIAGLQATLNRMRSVVTDPQERAVFENILSTANLNLGADSHFGVFADVVTQVESSSELSEETKASIRASIGVPDVNTGSQAQSILQETRVDEQGRTVPVWSEENPLPVRDGVQMYSDANHRQIMRTEFNGHIITIDTTGWSGEVVGKYLEAMSFVRDVESFGGTGLFQSIYRIDFNLTGEEGFDMHKVDQILNIMGKWFGGFEHADGDVRQNGDRRGFIRYVVRLLSKRGTATGFEESQADTDEVLPELNLRNSDGSPNWKQIDRLGDFARTTYISGDANYKDLKEHLVGTLETS